MKKRIAKKQLAHNRMVTAICVGVLIATPTSVFALYGDTAGMMALSTLTSSATSLATSLVASMQTRIAASTLTTSTAINMNAQSIKAAIGVAAKQESAGASQVSESNRLAAQQLVSAMQAQKKADALVDTHLAFGPTGQGFKPCKVVKSDAALSNSFTASPYQAADMVTRLDNAPGRLASSVADVTDERLRIHKQFFCTESEAQMGHCQLSALPAGDMNASLMFRPAAKGSLEQLARQTVRQNILGTPDLMTSKTAGATPAGQAYLFATNQKAALLSFPAYSLALIDANNTRTVQTPKGMMSPNEKLDETVRRSYGGDEAKEWEKTMIASEPRGILVDLAQKMGTEVWIHQQQFEQVRRMQGNLAALSLAAAQPIQRRLSVAANKMEHHALSNSVN